MMDVQASRGRGLRIHGAGGRTQSKNRKWVAGQDNASSGHTSDSERRERRGHGRKRHGHGGGTSSPFLGVPDSHQLDDGASGTEDDHSMDGDIAEEAADDDTDYPPDPETPQERERFWQELVKAREAERKKAIAEGKMDDPTVPRRLDEAITMVGTCVDMCPRFERYRRERENNLDKWEVIPGTKRVDHKRAVKIYERAAGDKTLPSDLRPPPVLKASELKTLDYLFHDLLVREGFTQTYDFIRDRSRAVRSDFTMQHEQGPLAIECHDRCARFHVLALHLERDNPRFSVALEEQQLMNTLQSLKEFYEDQRGTYEAPTELEMRVYHRLIHIRDQKERREDVPEWITSHPVFQYTTQFRQIVQAKSAPITKTSRLIVDGEGMKIFGKLAAVLGKQGNTVMIYLVACILERLFGKDTIEDIEAIRGDLTIPEIIDGISRPPAVTSQATEPVSQPLPGPSGGVSTNTEVVSAPSAPSTTSAFASSSFATPTVAGPSTSSQPVKSAFGNLTSKPNPFGGSSVFGGTSAFSATAASSSTTSAPSSSTTTSAFASFANGSTTFLGTSSSAPQTSSTIFGSTSFPSSSSGTLSGLASTATTSQASPKVTTSQTNGGVFGAPTSQLTSLNPMAPAFTPFKSTPTSFFSTPPAVTQPSPPARPEASPFASSAQPSQPATTLLFPSAAPAPVPALPTFPSPAPPPLVSFTPPPATQLRPPHASSLTAPLPAPPTTTDRQPLFTTPPAIGSLQSQPQTSPSYLTPSTSGSNIRPPGSSGSRPRISLVPPPLRKEPVNLPYTPTTRWFDPNSGKQSATPAVSRKNSLLNFPKPFMPPTNSAELLSPLQLNSPGFPKSSAAVNGSPSPPSRELPSQPLVESPTRVEPAETSLLTEKPPASSKAKGKARAEPVDLDKTLSEYLKAKNLKMMKYYYKRWEDKTIEHGQWMEACERGEAYKAKLRRQSQRIPPTFSTPTMQSLKQEEEPKKRRMSAGELIRPRRMRRTAHYEQPLTDEELARRLKENHEETKMRWTIGTFVRSLRTHLKSINTKRRPLAEWRLWLAVNPFFDPTAIWLEKKFDAESLGDLSIELVTALPAVPTPKPFPRGSPGLIVFERTPLERIKDDIEKRLRVLDDIVRLRDIVASLPPVEDRRFIPTLIVVHWIGKDEADVTEDFAKEAKKHLDKGTFKSMHILSAPHISGGLDPQFSEFLKSVTFDLEDHLMETVSWKALTKRFATPFTTAVSDWLDSCWTDDNFDWLRYEHVMAAIRDLQNDVVRLVLALVDRPHDIEVKPVADPESYVHFGKGHMMGPFVDALAKLAIETAEQVLTTNASVQYTVEKARLERTLSDLDAAVQTHSGRLREQWLAAMSERSSSKRPAEDDESVLGSLPSSHSQKRLRSDSGSSGEGIVPLNNGISMSPSPSIAPSLSTEGDKPYVSAAMLRSLTRDVLRKYGKQPQENGRT
ncbi:hypothetical protein DAEQUDRAFT_813670 [Daedalea quercina L-15889]|uniref:SAC3/GANP/THP3 conserved domain-containing protein n=1 Tax=Daedalea quercina L-15889 TaxID=1314783 RepID=A0A165MZM9_9APHY|nr:hypothetical protein DAEQUDRAFT_813670 [Daedalea quercina L-15889]